MPVKFLHSADWQIGQKASHVAAAANTVRGARLDAARAVIEAANHESVDAVILAGDQFEDNLVEDKLVHAVNEILAGSRAPVFVLPGNHDALTHDSIYWRASWKSGPSNVFLLKTNEPVSIRGTDVSLFPAPVFQKKSPSDPTGEIHIPASYAGIRIGVAHGSLRIEGKFSEDDFPIDLRAHERIGVDYLALGHWHGHFIHDGKVVYSGTHETCSFGEKNSGQALIIEIAAPGAPPRISEVQTGQLNWLTEELDFDLGTETALQVVRNRILSLEHAGKTLMRIRTRGHSGADAGLLLQAFEEEMASRLLFLTIERRDTPSALVQGKLAEMAANYPIVGGLISGITARDLSADESGAAMQLLFEILSSEAR